MVRLGLVLQQLGRKASTDGREFDHVLKDDTSRFCITDGKESYGPTRPSMNFMTVQECWSNTNGIKLNQMVPGLMENLERMKSQHPRGSHCKPRRSRSLKTLRTFQGLHRVL